MFDMALVGVPFDTAVSYRTGKLHKVISSCQNTTTVLVLGFISSLLDPYTSDL